MILLSNKIAVGHCVIINHVEQPCGKLLSVITSFDKDTVTTKYLNADKTFNPYKKGCTNRISEVTPIGLFGVEVFVNLKTEEYCCQKTPFTESIAKYHDGKIRPWQEHGGAHVYKANAKVLKIATKALKQEKLEDAGWKFGTVSDFLKLTREDEEKIAIKLKAN